MTPTLQLTTEQQAAKATANREAAAARAAAKKESGKQTGKDGSEYVPSEDWFNLSSAEKKAKTKARADVEEKDPSGN